MKEPKPYRVPKPERKARPVWVYFLTRDSDAGGVLSDWIDVWYVAPRRSQLTIDAGWVWENDIDLEKRSMIGYQGFRDLESIARWCGTVPDNDREMIRVERSPTPPKEKK